MFGARYKKRDCRLASLKYLRNLTTRIAADTRGSMATIFAFTCLVLILIIGVSIDYSTSRSKQQKSQNHLDAASLMLLKTYVSTNDFEASKAAVLNLLDQQFGSDESWEFDFEIVETVDETESINEISLHATGSGQVDTAVMGIFGAQTMYSSIESVAAVNIPSASVVVVPDISWTMSRFGRMAALKDAMEEFSDVFYAMDTVYSDKMKVSVVPYAATVNLKDYANKADDFLTDFEYRPNLSKAHTHQKHYKSVKLTDGNILRIDTMDFSGSQPIADTQEYIRNGGNWDYVGEVDAGRPWTYCIQAEETEFGSDDMLISGGSRYYPDMATGFNLPYCPNDHNRIRTEIASKSQFDGIANGLSINYWTRHDIGMLWATRILSPDWSDFFGTEDRPWNSAMNPKYVILLSDGKMSSPHPGVEAGQDPDANFDAACDFLKDKGVRIISISYDFSDDADGEIDSLSDCASSGFSYKADTADIDILFGEIAKDIKTETLRLAN